MLERNGFSSTWSEDEEASLEATQMFSRNWNQLLKGKGKQVTQTPGQIYG
jgi:hypothetical protein